MKKLTIIHYYPVSYFPPTMNLANIISDKVAVEIITSKPEKGPLDFNSPRIKVKSPVRPKSSDSLIVRLVKYAYFTIYSLIRLIFTKPDNVMYYESTSAYPVYLYKRYFNKSVNVYIHYHEYCSDYENAGNRIMLYNHRLECKWLYAHATWLSQTNEKRRSLFMDDCPMIPKQITHVFPNYPPKSWYRTEKKHDTTVVRCVYIGSLSLDSTFIKEFAEWVCRQEGKVKFDIYSYNFHQDTLQYLESLNSSSINFYRKGISYFEIPQILDKYDVGVLLYKAKGENMKWNETNKFYEYLICGLDVWYPNTMTLISEKDKREFAPSVVEFDYENLPNLVPNLKDRVNNEGYEKFADIVYLSFMNNFLCR